MASEGAFAVTAEPAEFEEALRWFRDRFPVTEELLAVLGSYAGQRAWTIAAVADLDLVMTSHALIGRGIEEGWDRKRLGRELRKVLTNFSEARCETIARTNVQKAYMAGRWEQLNDPDILDVMPYWVYDAILDGRTTDICTARDGTTLRHDDPWWLSNFPPLHFNCRTNIRAATEVEAEMADASKRLPPLDADPPGDTFGRPPPLDAPYAPNPSEYTAELFDAYQAKQRARSQ